MPLWGKTDTLASAPKYISPVRTFDASSASVVVAADDTIVIPGHGLSTGEAVLYSNGGGTAPTGLTNATTYYVIRVDGNTIKLAASLVNANAGTAVDVTAVGVGAAHTIKVVPAAVFIDSTEATIESNRDVGLKTPGWTKYETYTNTGGVNRKRVEVLVPMRVAAGDAGDAGVSGAGDDAIAADS